MSMSKETAAALAREGRALLDLFNSSQIDCDMYRKCQVKLASEYMAVGEPQMAQQVLRGLSEGYVDLVLEEQLRADTAFRQMAVALCEQLVKDGWVYLGDEWNFHYPPTSA